MTNALIHIFIRDAENTGDSRVREKFGVLSGAVGLACNLFLFALKLIIGLLTGSISIAADAFNNLSEGAGCEASVRLRTHRVHRGTDRLVHHHSGRLRVLQNLARPHSASGCRSVLGGADGDSCRIHAG